MFSEAFTALMELKLAYILVITRNRCHRRERRFDIATRRKRPLGFHPIDVGANRLFWHVIIVIRIGVASSQ